MTLLIAIHSRIAMYRGDDDAVVYRDLTTPVFDATSSALMAVLQDGAKTLPDVDALINATVHTMYTRDVRPNRKVRLDF